MGGQRYLKRKSIDSEHDSYMPKEGMEEPARCWRCGNIYHDKRWFVKEDAPKEVAAHPMHTVLCPACKKEKEHYPQGFVTIQGKFINKHKEEILHLIRNKEKLSGHINPLERIIEIKEKDDIIEITTTTEKLAQRIGQMLTKALKGHIEYKWSDDAKIARVVWERDNES